MGPLASVGACDPLARGPIAAPAPPARSARTSYRPLASSQRSASIAAMHPVPAAVTAWR